MVTTRPYKLDCVTKTGYGEPVPIKRFGVFEPQEDIDRCLDCTAPKCYGNCEHGKQPKKDGEYRNYSQYKSYYVAHREEILAKKRVAYQAKKEKGK